MIDLYQFYSPNSWSAGHRIVCPRCLHFKIMLHTAAMAEKCTANCISTSMVYFFSKKTLQIIFRPMESLITLWPMESCPPIWLPSLQRCHGMTKLAKPLFQTRSKKYNHHITLGSPTCIQSPTHQGPAIHGLPDSACMLEGHYEMNAVISWHLCTCQV